MADISRLSRLAGGVQRHVDLASNTLVVLSIKVGGASENTELTKAILDRLVSLQNGSDVDATYHTHDGRYYTETELGSTANGEGASLIGIEDAAAQFTATDVEGALAEGKALLDGHLDGDASKHDATEVDYERDDGSKKDIQAGSDDVESALTDLDDNKISKTGSIAFTGDQSMGGNKLTNVADPTLAQDAATKAYVDTVAQGLEPKGSVVAASTDNVDVATALEDGDTLDGITLATGDRVLLKNQTDPIDNGVYVVAASGAASRATDFDGSPENEVKGGDWVYVEGGTVNGGTSWAVLGQGNKVVNTDPINFTKINKVTPIQGGDGIDVTGDVISAKVDDASIEIASDQLRIKDAGVTTTKIAGDAVDGTKIRLANDQYVRGRNAANDGDVNIIKVNASDELELGARLNGEIAYTPSDASDWNGGSDPGDVDDALDQLADRVKTLETESSQVEALSETLVLGEDLTGVTGVRAFRFMRAADDGFVAGRVTRADNDASLADNFHVVGLYVAANDASGASIVVVKQGRMTVTSHGFTAGEPIWLGATGQLTNTAPSAADSASVLIGYARDANTIEVKVQIMGVN